MRSKFIISLVLACLVLPNLSLGTSPDITTLNKPLDYALGIVGLIPRILVLARIIPGAENALYTRIAEGLGINKIKTGNSNIAAYTGKDENDPAFSDMVKAWVELNKAKLILSSDGKKSVDLLKQAFVDSTKAYLEEEYELQRDVETADRMGLDKVEYSGYGELIGTKGFSDIQSSIKETDALSKLYSNTTVIRINNRISKAIKDFEDMNITSVSQILFISNKLDALLLSIIASVDLSDYYNRMFSGNSLFTDMVKERSKIEDAMKQMHQDFNELKKEYEDGAPKRPGVILQKPDVVGVIKSPEDTMVWLSLGDKAMNDSMFYYKKSIRLANAQEGDNYLFNAISMMRQAISLEKEADEDYKKAKQLEDQWVSTINQICNSKMTYKSELAQMYYIEGRKLCQSSKLLTKLEGAKSILFASKISTAPESKILEEIKDKVYKTKEFLDKAKADGIETSDLDHDLEGIERDISNLENYDYTTRVITIERDSEKLDEIRYEAQSRLSKKYSDIPEKIKWLEAAGVPISPDIREYASSKEINWDTAPGHLSDVDDKLNEEINKYSKDINLVVRKWMNISSIKCNETKFIQVVYQIENPSPTKITKSVMIGETPTYITLNGTRIRQITNSEELTPVVCTISKREIMGAKIYDVKISLKYPSKDGINVYLPIYGNLSGPVDKDKRGYYVPKVRGNRTIELISSDQIKMNLSSNEPETTRHETLVKARINKTVSSITPKQEGSGYDYSTLYQNLKDKLEKNIECVPSNVLSSDQSESGIKMMQKALIEIEKSASIKAGKLVESGVLTNKEAQEYLENDRFCDILKMKIPEKADTTALVEGKSNFTEILPVLAILGVMYIVIKGRKKGDTPRMKRILKSIE